jgi:hypothetical protein
MKNKIIVASACEVLRQYLTGSINKHKYPTIIEIISFPMIIRVFKERKNIISLTKIQENVINILEDFTPKYLEAAKSFINEDMKAEFCSDYAKNYKFR